MKHGELPDVMRPQWREPCGKQTGVLLCHGISGSPDSLRPWADYLAERGHGVALPLLPGHGTTWQDLNTVHWQDWYHEAEAALDWLQERCEHVVVAGLSMGGALALRIAERRPVAGLVLVNPAIASNNRSYALVPKLSRFVGSVPGIGGNIKRKDVHELAYPRTPLRGVATMLAMWADVRENLDRVQVPVLLFTSREDHVVDTATGTLLDSTLPDLEWHWLENSYHVATLDNDADTIFAMSEEFIARVCPPARLA